jgi:hypothetical protein
VTGKIELVFFDGCPHTEQARARLREAFSQVGLPAAWAECDALGEGTPDRYRHLPSPTVLVDGVDVTGGSAGGGASCAMSGGPTTVQIINALRALSSK